MPKCGVEKLEASMIIRRYYHGTSLTNLKSIIRSGLINPHSYDPNWYLLATDFETASDHKQRCVLDTHHHYVIEFELLLEEEDWDNDVFWTGYPMLNPEYAFSERKIWASPRETIPTSCIKAIHRVNLKSLEMSLLDLNQVFLELM